MQASQWTTDIIVITAVLGSFQSLGSLTLIGQLILEAITICLHLVIGSLRLFQTITQIGDPLLESTPLSLDGIKALSGFMMLPICIFQLQLHSSNDIPALLLLRVQPRNVFEGRL